MSRHWLGLLLFAITIAGGGVARADQALTVVPASPVDFGSVRTDGATATTLTQTFTITNSGTAGSRLVVSDIALANGDGGTDYVITAGGATPFSLGLESRTVTVQLNPSVVGTRTATLTITSDAPANGTKVINLTGSGTSAVIAVTDVNFNTVNDTTTSSLNIAVTNSAAAATRGPLRVAGASIAGGSFFSFGSGLGCTAGSTTCTFNPALVINGGTSSVPVRCAPPALASGTQTATVTFVSDTDPSTSTISRLSCTAGRPNITVSETALAFGDVPVGQSPTRTFTITNDGTTPLTYSIVENPNLAQYTISASTGCVSSCTLNPAAASTITVTFTPDARAAFNTRLDISSDDPDPNDNLIHVAVSGTSGQGILVAAPTSIDFGAVDVDGPPPSSMMVSFTNTGEVSLDITIAAMAGASAAFHVTLPPGVTPLAPGASLPLTITYAPTATLPANQHDQIVLVAQLSGVAGGQTQASITATGRGIDRTLEIAAVPAFPPTFRNPGDAAPVQAITVRNTGEAPLSISALMITGDPVWQLAEAGPIDIPGGGSHDVLVRFSPTTIGAAPAGQLTLMNNDNANPMAVVTLSGEGKNRDVAFAAPMIDLGHVAVGGEVTVELLTVINHDPANPFTVREIALDAGSAFAVAGEPGSKIPASAATLERAGSQTYAVTFAPTAEGDFHATATLYLDQDPVPQATIELVGHASSVSVHGGGGCSTTGGATGGAVIALVALLVRRRRTRAAALAAFAVLAGAPGVLGVHHARADDVVIGLFDPAPATRTTGFQLESPEVGAPGAWVASGVVSYATDLLAFDTYDSGMRTGADRAIKQRTMFTLGGAYAFLDRFEAGLRLPMYVQHGDPGGAPRVMPAAGTALGDLTLHLKARLARTATTTLGAALHATLPTATAGQFTGVDAPTLRGLGLAAWSPLDRLTVSASAGFVLRKTSVYRDAASISQGSGLVWGAGVSGQLVGALWVTGEVFGELTTAGRSELGSNTVALAPVEALAGVTYRLPRVVLGVAIGRGLTDGIGAPDLRGVVTASYVTGAGELAPRARRSPPAPGLDSDGDGIADAVDKCPNEPEDKDGFEDDDGCPDLDNDHDGIADAVDKCPDQPETVNGKDDDDGCPDSVEIAVDSRFPLKGAEVTFQKGRDLLARGQYREACDAFEQSQRLDPQSGTQYNIAGCFEKLGKVASAWSLYSQLARSDANLPRRARSARLAEALAARVPKLKLVLTGAPPGLQVTMNGASANTLIGIETPVDLGNYTVLVTATGYRAWRKTVEIKEDGKVVSVVINLQPSR